MLLITGGSVKMEGDGHNILLTLKLLLLLFFMLMFTGGSVSPLSLVVVATAVVYRREC
jgi:hypothetical protein